MFFIIFAVGFGTPACMAIAFTIYHVVRDRRRKRAEAA